MPAAVESSFDVAFWFYDRALNDNEYLQPQKLQRLLFLAQAYYAAVHEGRRLMPSVFVIDEQGPIEPNIYRAFEDGRPIMNQGRMAEPVRRFLDSVWRRFGAHSASHLSRLVTETSLFREYARIGRFEEIPLDAMRRFYERGEEAPAVDNVLRSRVLRSQEGRAVAVQKWTPPAVGPKKG